MQLKRFPPLGGVMNLRNIFLARLFGITELPSLAGTPLLGRIEFAYIPNLRMLPDPTPVANTLHSFALYRPCHVCCNGFLGGGCNITHPFCAGIPSATIPPATCVGREEEHASATTLTLIQRLNDSICQPSTIDFASDFPDRDRANLCGGVLFRQCQVANRTGICYNSRMQVIGCTTDPNKIKIRQLQIERGAGLPCNVEEEAWLGCGNHTR